MGSKGPSGAPHCRGLWYRLSWDRSHMDLEPHGSESRNQCVPEPLQVETKRGRETPRPKRGFGLNYPKEVFLEKEERPGWIFLWEQKRERRPMPKPFTSGCCQPHTHTRNCRPNKISGAGQLALLPYRGIKDGLGKRGRTIRREHETINSLFIPLGCKREDLKGYKSTLRQSDEQRGKWERRNNDSSTPHVVLSPDRC